MRRILLRTRRVAFGAVAVISLWSTASHAITCDAKPIPDCRPCRWPVCTNEGFWVCSAPPMEGKGCNVLNCGTVGTCSNGVCNPLPNSNLRITKIGRAGAVADPGATISVVPVSTCQVGGTVPAGVASQSVEVTPGTSYTISSTVPADHSVYWSFCTNTCNWTPGTSVTFNAPISGTMDLRFLYRHYTQKTVPLVARYYRFPGYTKWFIFANCVDQISEINVQSLDFPSDLPRLTIARAARNEVRNSPDGWGKCVLPVGTVYAGSNSCPEIATNNIGVESTVRVYDDPSFSNPAWFDATGSYPFPDACELIEDGDGAQVCHAQPYPRNVIPRVSLPITVTPLLDNGIGCTNMFIECNNRCGSLDFGYVVLEPGLALWCYNNCNPPGPVTEHWRHIFADDRLTQVSGLIGGGKWNDEVCTNGVLCRPGSTCRLPEIADTDFGPHHLDRDFNFSIIPIRNGAIDGSVLNPVDVHRKTGGGFPTIDVEIEYHYFYPRQGPATFSTAFELIDTFHPSIKVKAQAAPGPPFKGFEQGPSFRSPVQSIAGDAWSIDLPTAGDQVAAKGVLVSDCGHLESDGTAYGGQGFHTEIHPVVATAWLHRPMPGDPQPQSGFATLFVRALSHAPYPSGTYHPFDGLDATFSLADYDSSLPFCISEPVVDHNAGKLYSKSKNRTGSFLDFVDYPKDDPYGLMVARPDLPGTKYWNLAATHLGGGTVQLTLAGNFPGGSDYNILEHPITPEFPLMLGAHFELCQLATDSSGTVTRNCRGRCAIPPSGVCPFGTGATGGACVPIVAPTGLVATPVGNASNTVNISWNPIPAATGYKLYWGDGAAGGPLTAFPGPIASTSVSDVRNWGSTYHYVVTALNGSFESASSNVAAVTLYPAAPSGVTATGGMGQVTVSWVAANGATQYRVYRIDGASSALAATTTSTGQTFSGLASQTTYSYAVEAWNAAGGSTRSAIASATTLYQCSASNCAGCCSANVCYPGSASDPNHCGVTCAVCPGIVNGSPICSGGACGVQCNAGYSLCGGQCVNTSSDVNNCGWCGLVCDSRHTCAAGACVCKSMPTACPRNYYWDADICACSQ